MKNEEQAYRDPNREDVRGAVDKAADLMNSALELLRYDPGLEAMQSYLREGQKHIGIALNYAENIARREEQKSLADRYSNPSVWLSEKAVVDTPPSVELRIQALENQVEELQAAESAKDDRFGAIGKDIEAIDEKIVRMSRKIATLRHTGLGRRITTLERQRTRLFQRVEQLEHAVQTKDLVNRVELREVRHVELENQVEELQAAAMRYRTSDPTSSSEAGEH